MAKRAALLSSRSLCSSARRWPALGGAGKCCYSLLRWHRLAEEVGVRCVDTMREMERVPLSDGMPASTPALQQLAVSIGASEHRARSTLWPAHSVSTFVDCANIRERRRRVIKVCVILLVVRPSVLSQHYDQRRNRPTPPRRLSYHGFRASSENHHYLLEPPKHLNTFKLSTFSLSMCLSFTVSTGKGTLMP